MSGIIGPVTLRGFVLYDGAGNQLSQDQIAAALNGLPGALGPRLFMADGHLVLRLPHNQTHLVQDLNEEELAALRDACEARLLQLRADADRLVRFIAGEKAKAEPAAGPDQATVKATREAFTAQALRDLAHHGITAEPLETRCADGLPHYRLTWPGGVSQTVEAKEVRRRADALRKKAKAS